MNIREVPETSHCIEIGMITRPHGKDGEVLVSAKNIDYEDFRELKYVFFRLQERMVPFFIDSVTIKSNSLFVKFEDISTMEKAEQYCSTRLYIENDGDSENEESDDDRIGFTVIDNATHQEIGKIHEIIAYSMNVVLDVTRADGTSVLLPYAEDLLVDLNEEHQTITLRIPEGLLE